MSNRAYFIAIDNYEHLSSLQTPQQDAAALTGALKKLGQPFDLAHPILANAKLAGLQTFFQDTLPAQLGAEDRVFLMFSGHGVAIETDEGRPTGYLLPADAQRNNPDSWLPMRWVMDQLAQLPCSHLLLVLDCCFAGSVKWTFQSRSAGFDTPKKIYRQRYRQYQQSPAWQVLTSAAASEKAIDYLGEFRLGARGATQGNSPFVAAFLKALGGAGDIYPPEGGDGLITATELYLYLRDVVQAQTGQVDQEQTPLLFTLPKHEKGEFLFATSSFRESDLDDWNEEQNPYKGLLTYEEADASLFYGREREVGALAAQLNQPGPLLAVTGVSGSGKSSLVQAGLLPMLRKEGKYHILTPMKPGRHPMAGWQKMMQEIDPDKPNILLIDQLEEVVTQCQQEEEQVQFLDALRTALAGKQFPLGKIIVTVRADFEPWFATHASLRSAWVSQARYPVPWFQPEELREIIVRPAVQAGVSFDPPGLVTRIITEVQQSPGALPLLSFALSELYELYRQRRAQGDLSSDITDADYGQLGGVIGAIGRRADALYLELDQAHQATLRHVLLRMVSLEGVEPAKKRIREQDIQFVSAGENKRRDAVMDALLRARLIVTGQEDSGKRYYEPAHDALVRSWHALSLWITSEHRNILLLDALNTDLSEYEQNANSKLLYHDNPRLELLKELQATPPEQQNVQLNVREIDFINKSIAEKERRTRRRRRELIGAFSVLGVLLLGAIFFAVLSNRNASRAEIQTQAAEKNLADFARADSIRQVEEAAKERLNFDKLVAEGDVFTNSNDYNLAMKWYLLADTIRMKFPKDAGLIQKAESLSQKIETARRYLNQQ